MFKTFPCSKNKYCPRTPCNTPVISGVLSKLLDTTFAAIRQEGKRKQLLEGYKEVYETTERNKEITPYISIEVHNQTAANFEKECEAVLEI